MLARRDHFDARFQLIQEDEEGVLDSSAGQSETVSSGDTSGRVKGSLSFLDAPSDLVPWVYEGGLKTWECSLDLVDYLDDLHGDGIGAWVQGKKILEVSQLTSRFVRTKSSYYPDWMWYRRPFFLHTPRAVYCCIYSAYFECLSCHALPSSGLQSHSARANDYPKCHSNMVYVFQCLLRGYQPIVHRYVTTCLNLSVLS